MENSANKRRKRKKDFSEVIAPHIKQVRIARGFSEWQVAQYLETTVPYYCSIERGEHQISIDTIESLSFCFGVEIEDLLKNDKLDHIKQYATKDRLLMLCNEKFDQVPAYYQRYILHILLTMLNVDIEKLQKGEFVPLDPMLGWEAGAYDSQTENKAFCFAKPT